MQKAIKFLTILLFTVLVSFITGCTNIKYDTTHLPSASYFNKGVYRTYSEDNKNSYKNYFFIFNDGVSGHTEDSKMGIGLPFSCVQKDGFVKFKFGGVSEPEVILKVISSENGIIKGYFEDGSLLMFTLVSNANPDNFDAIEYLNKSK